MGKWRWESVAVSPWPGKCLAVVRTGYFFAPSIKLLTKAPTISGVSPKARILITGFSGLLFTSAMGAKTQLMPMVIASLAVISPISVA